MTRTLRKPIVKLLRRGEGSDFAGWTTTLQSLVAPGSAEITPTYVRSGASYLATLAVDAFPRRVHLGHLRPLFDLEGVDVVQSIHPLSSDQTRQFLKKMRKYAGRTVAEDAILSGGVDDEDAAIGLEDVDTLRVQAAKGEERLYDYGVYLLVSAGSELELKSTLERVEDRCADQGLATFRTDFRHWQGLETFLPTGRDHLLAFNRADTSTVALSGIPVAPPTPYSRQGSPIFYGEHYVSGAPVLLDVFTLDSPHLAICAATGSGKTYLISQLIIYDQMWGHTRYLVIDPKDQEYKSLITALGGQYVVLGGRSHQHLNPLDLGAGSGGAEMDPLGDKISFLKATVEQELLARDRGLSPLEAATLERAFYLAYASHGITSDPDTHTHPPPRFSDVQAVLGTLDAELAAHFALFTSGTIGAIFDQPTNVKVSAPLIGFDCHLLVFGQDPTLARLAPAFIFEFCNSVILAQRQKGPAHKVVVDEAWSLLQHSAGGQAIAQASRVYRSLGASIQMISQRPQDFTQSTPEAATFFANTEVKILLKMKTKADRDEAGRYLGLTPGERDFLDRCGLDSQTGSLGLMLAGDYSIPLFVPRAPRAIHRLITGEE